MAKEDNQTINSKEIKVSKEEEIKVSKEELIKSKRYECQRDIISAILIDNETYTLEQVDKLISQFLQRKVIE